MKERRPEDPPAAPPPRRIRKLRRDPLGPDSQIGSRLRELYTAVENEPIPTMLIDLLEQLDEAERRGRE